MKMLTKMAIALAASALALPGISVAAQAAASPIALVGDVKAEKVITAPDGTEQTILVEPTAIIPGDRLIFGTDYAHGGGEAVNNFIVTNPLPTAVRLAPDADPALEVSVDGGKSWGTLAALTIANPDGTTRPAAHADVTHVRWVLESIAPGATGRLTYPAIIR
ncbi:MAG: hypothetical protein CVT75_02625 [Alphaproteobacteria bacterium HGW-Alphaproteobacteria-14]|nr:MAG: hypothetical protein CVT75_02625 [Alphaproteobacteria bacterium HGW-Alphaproteobacteria-14]